MGRLRYAPLAVLLAFAAAAVRAADWTPQGTADALTAPRLDLARFQAERAPADTLDQLSDRADAAYHAGHWWEMRRLMFKIVDLDPTDYSTLGTLALVTSLYRSETDAENGKDNVVYAASDFDDLGGLASAPLLRIAEDPNPDRFAKSRAIFAWGEAFNRDNPDFYIEYAQYVGYRAGDYHRIHKDYSRAVEEIRAGVQAYSTAFRLASARSSGRIAPLHLLSQGNLCLRLTKLVPDQSAADRALAISDYRLILADPQANDGFKTSARRHLAELGEPVP